jgi:hypothetical protein
VDHPQPETRSYAFEVDVGDGAQPPSLVIDDATQKD